MTSDAGDEARTDEVVRAEAVVWLAKLRAPNGADQHDAFETWYAVAPRHADIYDDVLFSWDRTALAALTPAGENRGRLNAGPNTQARSKIAFAAVAALILIVLAGVGWQRFGSLAPTHRGPIEIASRLGEIRTVTLADRSRVTLDTATIVSVAYTTGERRLTLKRGRARFDVAHEPGRPFVVVCGPACKKDPVSGVIGVQKGPLISMV